MALNFGEASKFARSFLSSVRGRLVKPGFLDQPTGPSSMVLCTDESCASCSDRRKAKRGVRIVFLCFAATHPNGGVKVIYRQAELVAAAGVESCVFQPDVPDYNTKWFSHGATVERVGHFDPRQDFLIVPELMATVVARFCIPAKIRYAIYVQNGYIMNSFGSSSSEEVELAYLHASLVLAISDDTAEIVKLAFPGLPQERVVRMRLSVRDIFKVGSKERIITFMPRKLREHTALVMFFLRHHVPPGWSVVPIDQMSEDAVAETFARSGIFLSFSHLEGLGLPPIEAALAGTLPLLVARADHLELRLLEGVEQAVDLRAGQAEYRIDAVGDQA